jgi:hypothetical protein
VTEIFFVAVSMLFVFGVTVLELGLSMEKPYYAYWNTVISLKSWIKCLHMIADSGYDFTIISLSF